MAKITEKTILDYALEYYQRGWSIIPIKTDTKKPAVKWKKFQTVRADEKQLREWFADSEYTSLAVVCGAASGGLAVLDLDSEQRCKWWYENHAYSLPTVKTNKGIHLFIRTMPFKKKNGDGLDLLCEGAYAILPPSPDKEWVVPLNGKLPFHDPFEWGLEQFDIKQPYSLKAQLNVPNVTEHTEQTEHTEHTEHTDSIEVNKFIEKAMELTLPHEFRTRNRKIFSFAKALRDKYQDADPKTFRNVVKEWHRQALSKIRTKDFAETWYDFLVAWDNVKYFKGVSPMIIYEKAVKLKPPKFFLDNYPDNKLIQRMAVLCKEMQKACGDRPFFLSARTVAGLLGMSPMQASRYLNLLVKEGLLEIKEKGGTKENPRKATRFKYIAD